MNRTFIIRNDEVIIHDSWSDGINLNISDNCKVDIIQGVENNNGVLSGYHCEGENVLKNKRKLILANFVDSEVSIK